jgi:hypothetical protein
MFSFLGILATVSLAAAAIVDRLASNHNETLLDAEDVE